MQRAAPGTLGVGDLLIDRRSAKLLVKGRPKNEMLEEFEQNEDKRW